MMRWILLAATMSLVSCDDPLKNVPTTQERARDYKCNEEELTMMTRYFKTCMTGAGYTSDYCLDRAVLATCHDGAPAK